MSSSSPLLSYSNFSSQKCFRPDTSTWTIGDNEAQAHSNGDGEHSQLWSNVENPDECDRVADSDTISSASAAVSTTEKPLKPVMGKPCAGDYVYGNHLTRGQMYLYLPEYVPNLSKNLSKNLLIMDSSIA